MKINYEGDPTHNLVQIPLEDCDRENFSEIEIVTAQQQPQPKQQNNHNCS